MASSKRTHIAVISHWGFKSLHGGNLRAYFLIRELIQRNCKITLLLADENDVEHCRKLFGCEAISFNEPMSRWQPIWKKIIQYLIFGHKIRKHLDRNSYDAVFGVNLVQALPAVRQKRSESWVLYVDLWADFFDYDAPPSLIKKIITPMVRWAEFYTMRKADKLVMITDTMRKLIPERSQNKVKIIPDGADTERFTPDPGPSGLLQELKISEFPVFSYQGGIARHEGLDRLCRAAPYVLKKLPNAKFLIVGKGDFLKECQEIVKENHSDHAFIFTGWVDYAEMPKILGGVDISVVPMPNVRAARPIISFKLLEAMASGTLVVANRLPGLMEVVDESMVVLTNADDPEEFAEGLISAHQLPIEKKQEMRKKSLEKIASLDWREIAKRDVEYFSHDL